MRFQTISIIAICAIGLGAAGIYKSQAINSLINMQKQKDFELVQANKTVRLVQLKKDYTVGDFIGVKDLKLVSKKIEDSNEEYDEDYFTDLDDLTVGSFVTVESLHKGDYLKKENIKRLGDFENVGFETRDVVLTVGTELVTKVEPGLYDLYWYFQTDNGDREIKKLKKFAINVYIRNRDLDKKDSEIEESNSNLRSDSGVEVIAKVRSGDVEKYLQALQDGKFKILDTTSNINEITDELYTKLVVTTSKEIQSNDISKSYKYNISVIKG